MTSRNPVLRCLHHWPTRVLCVSLTILQAAALNWYLMHHLSYKWAAMYAADAIVVGLFMASFNMATKAIRLEKKSVHQKSSVSSHQPLTYVAWFVYGCVLDIKVAFIFSEFSTHLDEDYFFAPNTCKTCLALAGLIFITFLNTQHDERDGKRKAFVLMLTANVFVDILDGVKYIDNLFQKEVRDAVPHYLDDVMIVVCCVNFLLPTIPLLTLSLTRFGLSPLSEKLEFIHKIMFAYLVNLPLFVTRMITWHGFSQGISIFTLKNITVMGVVTFEVLQKWYLEEDSWQELSDKDKRETGTD